MVLPDHEGFIKFDPNTDTCPSCGKTCFLNIVFNAQTKKPEELLCHFCTCGWMVIHNTSHPFMRAVLTVEGALRAAHNDPPIGSLTREEAEERKRLHNKEFPNEEQPNDPFKDFRKYM